MSGDWRAAGRRLAAELAADRAQEPADQIDADYLEEMGDRFETSFAGSLLRYLKSGDTKGIVKYLRSRRPLPDDFREELAFALERGPRKPSRGARKKGDLRDIALVAEITLKRWVSGNKLAGISDRGHRKEMREEAIRIALDDEASRRRIAGEADCTVTAEAVHAHMARPKYRRNSP